MPIPEAIPTCTIQIGPLNFEICSAAPDLIARLLAAYPGFIIAPVVEPDVHLKVFVTGGDIRPLGAADPKIEREAARWVLTAPGFKGILADDGCARLELSAAFPTLEVDLFLRIMVAVLALRRGGILMHTAGVVRDGRAYLFFGHSGSGKTTASRLSAPRQVLNDDLVLLLPEDGVWMAYGTPFTNPTQVPPSPGRAPLSGIYRLVQDPQVYIRPISSAVLMAELLSCVPILAVLPQEMPHVVQIEADIIQKIGGGYLHFRKDPSFWDVIPDTHSQ
jgi:hypothetical protein